MSKKRSFFVIFIFLFTIAAYSKGSADKDYSEANELLKQHKNSDALESIAEVMDDNLESSEVGIKLAREAMQNQEEFRIKFAELMELLYNDPNNNEQKIVLIDELESIETKIEPDMQNFLTTLRDSSVYAIYKIYFNRLMDDGIALIKEGKYTEAYEKFTKGFSIYNNEFQKKYNGTRMQKQVNNEINSVQNYLANYKKSYANLMTAIEKYKKTPSERKSAAFKNVSKYFIELSYLEMKILNSGDKLKRLYIAESRRNKNIKESIFPFAYRIVLGRESAKYYEGVDGALQASIHKNLEFLENDEWDKIRKEWSAACSVFNLENNLPIDKNIREINLTLNELKKIATLHNKNSSSQFKRRKFSNESEKQSAMLALTRDIKITKNLYSDFLDLKRVSNDVKVLSEDNAKLEANSDNEEVVKSLTDKILSAKIEPYIDRISNLNTDLDKVYNNVNNEQKSLLPNIQQELSTKQALIIKESKNTEITFYEQFAIQKNIYGKISNTTSNKKYIVFNNFLKETEERPARPSKALRGFKSLKESITKDIDVLQTFINRADKVENLSSVVFSKNRKGVKYSITELNKLLKKLNVDIAKTEASMIKIQLARNEADLRYKQAVDNFKKGNFALARKNIELSREKTSLALLLEDDEEYRKETDERLLALGKKINDAENSVVIRDVRNYLERAKQFYFNGEFRKSENNLNLAKNRWAVTHIQENEEVTAWLAIVRTAGSLQTSRSIPVSAPLYPQMTQLLNNSTQLYLDSIKLIRNSQRAKAVPKLDAARENIKQVLLVYPFNAVAGQLNLKIDKLLDPQNFKKQFKKKIDVIKNNYKKNPQRHYSDLLDLYSIDKKTAGIKKLKYDIEIYLGLKLPPPDLKAIAESKRLTNAARKIYKSGKKLSFPVAVQQLDKAIKLNPKNMNAIRLKDAIQMSMGAGAVVVLSSADEKKYKKAVEELQKGNKVIAAALIQQLMQSPNAKNSAKVIELKKRLDAQL